MVVPNKEAWVTGVDTSVIALDIAQFFPSLNHNALVTILHRAGFNRKLVSFFSSYLVDRRTSYTWGNFTSPAFDCDVGVEQGSALSPILSSLYLSPAMWAFYKHLVVSDSKLISYVDDATLIAQSPTTLENNLKLWFAYRIFVQMLTDLGLVVEHSKTKLFHFSCKRNPPNPPIDLGVLPYIGANLLTPNTFWHYLGFYFDRNLPLKSMFAFMLLSLSLPVRHCACLVTLSEAYLPISNASSTSLAYYW